LGALEFVSEAIQACQKRAVESSPVMVRDPGLREFCRAEFEALEGAEGDARRALLKELNRKKKEFFRERAKKRLCKEAMAKPREGKEKKGGFSSPRERHLELEPAGVAASLHRALQGPFPRPG
jgi:hypothetical protein